MALRYIPSGQDDPRYRQMLAAQLIGRSLGQFGQAMQQRQQQQEQQHAVGEFLLGKPAQIDPGVASLDIRQAQGGPAFTPSQPGLLSGSGMTEEQVKGLMLLPGGAERLMELAMPKPTTPKLSVETVQRGDQNVNVLMDMNTGQVVRELGAGERFAPRQPSVVFQPGALGGGTPQEFIEIQGVPHLVQRDQAGNVTGVQPVPGTEPAVEREQQAQQAQQRQQQQATMADIVGQDIERALDLSEGAMTTGATGQFMSMLGGTSAHDLSNLLNTVKANVGFQQLQQMRANSPTGGALGQVSENENRLLQSVLGALEQSQSRDQFQFNLKRLFNTLNDVVHGSGNGPERFDLRAPGEPGGEGEGALDFSGMSPAEFGTVNLDSLSPEELDAYLAEGRRRGF